MHIIQVYANSNNEEDSDDPADNGEVTEVKEKTHNVTIIKKRIPKRQKTDAASIDGEENLPKDTGLSLEEDEDLALQLLMR